MKIYIDQIPDAGLSLSESCEPASLDLDRADIKFTEPISLSAQVAKQANLVSVDLKLDARMHLKCGRCLEEFISPLSREIKLNFPIANKQLLDLADTLREEIVLNYPLKPLCAPDCRGLCPSCGQNLNKRRCNCKPLPRTGRFRNGTVPRLNN